MADITIPPAALEAGKLVLLRGIYGDDQMPCAELARAAFLAIVEAWPGMSHLAENDSASVREMAAIILPLAQENSDEA